MLFFILKLKRTQWQGVFYRSFLIGFACLAIVWAMAIVPLQSAVAAPLTAVDAELCCLAQFANNDANANDAIDLEHAADKAEDASKNIFEGLDTTKEIIGKTEMRKQAIENAREHASDKWQSLADKARAAKRTGEPLSPVDELNLKRLAGEQS